MHPAAASVKRVSEQPAASAFGSTAEASRPPQLLPVPGRRPREGNEKDKKPVWVLL